MLLHYNSEFTLENKKALLSWFYPNLRARQNLLVSNENDKIVKICKRNKNIARLVDELDLMELK